MKKKKKVMVYKTPKAQEGMQMAEGAPQQQQVAPQQQGAPQEQGGGQEQQMQQLAAQVKQMLEQGAEPGQVIAELLQGGVPPEVIGQIFVGLGMPQEQVAPMIEQVMQQMQGGQEQAPQGPPQEGGQPMMAEGGEQDQMQQILMAFAQMVAQTEGIQTEEEFTQLVTKISQAVESGELTPDVMVQALEEQGQQGAPVNGQVGLSPQEQMMQQSMKRGGTVPPGYHRMPDGSTMPDSAMEDGGMVNEAMMGAINPTKGDFLNLKKQMLKEFKAGGTTKGFDKSNTEAYIQNLQGAVANHVSRNMRIGMINQKFDETLKEFDNLPKAKGGTQISDSKGNTKMVTEEEARVWYDALNDNPDMSFTDLGFASDNPNNNSAEYDSSDGNNSIRSRAPGVINPDTGKPMTWEQLDAIGGWKGFTDAYGDPKYYSANGGGQGARHYYEGYGPGQRSLGGKYFDSRFDKMPFYDLFNSFNKQATGKYNVEGFGELEGANVEDLNKKLADIQANPDNYSQRVTKGYLKKSGKIKKRRGLFGGRPEVVQYDYVGTGTPTTLDETTDGTSDEFTDEYGLRKYVGTRHDPTMLNEAPEGSEHYTNPVTGEVSIVSPEEAARIRSQGAPNWQGAQPNPFATPQGGAQPNPFATPQGGAQPNPFATPQGETDTTTQEEYTWQNMMEDKIANGTATPKEKKAYEDYMAESPNMSDEQIAKFEKKYDKKYGKETDTYDEYTDDEIRQLETNPRKAEKIIEKRNKAKDIDVTAGYDDNAYANEVDANYQKAAEMAGTTDENSEAFQKALDIVEGGQENVSSTGYYNNIPADLQQPFVTGPPPASTFNEQTGLYEYADPSTGAVMQFNPPNEKDYNPFGVQKQFQRGGLVSQPGKVIWNWKDMKFNNPPKSSMMYGRDGLMVNFPTKEQYDSYITKDPEGSIRVSEEQEKKKEWQKFGQAGFDSVGWLTDKVEKARQTDPTWVSTAERQKMLTPYDSKSGTMGLYNQWGDWRGDQSGQVGAGVRAGTGSDADVYGQFNQQNLYSDLMPGQTVFPMKKGGLVSAQLGMQVGDEVDLTEREIMELAKYGYQVTRM